MMEITYLPQVECALSQGFLENEVTAAVADENGRRQYLRVPATFVDQVNGKRYLPIGIVDLDYRGKRALIELPHEADSGANRLWVPFAAFRQASDAP